MKRTAQRIFAKRVQLALGWTLLFGLTASLNLGPLPAREHLVTSTRTQSMVVSPPIKEPNYNQLPKKQRVVKWFTEYDDIRRDAQMSGPEKASAIKMWATSFVSAGPAETADANALLTRMVSRYDHAQQRLAALPEIPETRALQHGYLAFFRQAKTNFQRYLDTLNTGSLQATVEQMQVGRQQLAEIDVRNKSLDRKLRERYHIPQID